MRLLDHDEPIDPEVAASLDAIDAVLAGEPVGAEYAELAEIALLLTAERPQVRPAFSERMDERVARRFAQVPPPAGRKPRRSSGGFWQAAGAMAAGVAVIVGIAIVASGHNGSSSASSSSSSALLDATPAPSAGGSASSAAAGTSSQRSPAASNGAEKSAASSAAATTASGSAPAGAPASLQPPTTGRKVVQSAQLQLAAPANRIDDVAQQVYNVIGQLNGIVERSTITQTGGLDGSANFQLSVPSASLGQAMSQLSSLHYASVLSRTDATQDITDQYGAAKRALSDARALRTSLLKQLASATTTEQIDSLKAQIRDAEASISSDQATLNRLNRQVGFSQLALDVNARNTPAPAPHHSGGFGIGRAAHDAGRVLTVAAGVALIALAALTPVALVAALLWWVGSALRRRRREQALDSAA
ncbi:MAG TPA: DUF4349 domain-containing protein [Solirubrobacteraceae bacterium]|nr:DUF4349 domain-containing protein [Solirubrobacteraceae bacterium]